MRYASDGGEQFLEHERKKLRKWEKQIGKRAVRPPVGIITPTLEDSVIEKHNSVAQVGEGPAINNKTSGKDNLVSPNTGAADNGAADNGAADKGAANDGAASNGAADYDGATDGNANKGVANDGAANEDAAHDGQANNGAANNQMSNKGESNKDDANKGTASKGAAIKNTSFKDQDVAGPSNSEYRSIRVQHSAPKFKDLEDDSEDEITTKKRPHQSDSGGESPETSNLYRRVPHATGELFDPPCSLCVKRRIDCKKDKFSAACTRCFIGKNRCDYGGRYIQNPNIRRPERRRRSGKGKARAKEEKPDLESEDDLPETDFEVQRRPAKRVRSAAYVDDSDSDAVMPSGYDTSQPPPRSRSPSPKPRREAAKRAEIAMAAAVRYVNFEEARANKRMKSSLKGI